MKLNRSAAHVNRRRRSIDSPACTESDSRFRQRGGKVARQPSPQSPVSSNRTRHDISPSSDWPASFFGRGEIGGGMVPQCFLLQAGCSLQAILAAI